MKNKYVSRILIIQITLLINSHVIIAQSCPTTTTGFSEAPDYEIDSDIDWTSEKYKLEEDLHIQMYGNLTIDGSLSYLRVNSGKFIYVENGGTLTITDGTQIYGNAAMWGGIVVEGGGTLIVNDGATIGNAIEAVYAESNVNGEALVEADGAVFCNNETGIHFYNYNDDVPMNSFVKNSIFHASALLTPLNGEIGDFGIVVESINEAASFKIGDDGLYSDLSGYNEFYDLAVGIYVLNSFVTVQNNYIHDLLESSDCPISDNVGIYAETTGSALMDLYVGDYAYTGPGETSQRNNRIKNAKTGIYAEHYVNVYVWSNDIISDVESSGNTFKMNRGFEATDHCGWLEVDDNTFTNFNQYGFYSHSNIGCDRVYVHFTDFTLTVEYDDAIEPVGVRISESSPQDLNVNLDGNTFLDVCVGIQMAQIDYPELYWNQVEYEHVSGGPDAYGFRMAGCNNAIIYFNRAENVGSSPASSFGFLLDGCTYFDLWKNRSDLAQAAFGIKGTSTEGEIACNQIVDCTYGFLLYNIGGGAISPPLHNPIDDLGGGNSSDNHWFDETANRSHSVGSTDGSALDWYFDDDVAAEYDIPAGTWTDDGFTAVSPNLVDDNSTECQSYWYRTDSNVNMALMQLESDYAEWAASFLISEVEIDPVSWMRMFGFWHEVTIRQMDPTGFSEDLNTLYFIVQESNIPLFYEICNLLQTTSFNEIESKLEIILPETDLEFYWKSVFELYLLGIDDSGIFSTNPELSDALNSIAILGDDFGPAVNHAWALLGIFPDIDFNFGNESPKLIAEHQFGKINIYPNPSDTYIYISSRENQKLLEELDRIVFIDVNGAIIKTITEPTSLTIFAGNLAAGLYVINLIAKSGEVKHFKILIQ